MDYGKNANLYPFFGCTFWCMLMFPLCHQDILCLDPKPKRENEKEGKAGCMSNCADKFAPKCCCARSIIDAKGGCCRHCFLRFYRCYLLSAVFSFGMTLIPFLLPFYIWPCEHCYARYCSNEGTHITDALMLCRVVQISSSHSGFSQYFAAK